MKIPKNFWQKVQHEYTSATPTQQFYLCHSSKTFQQHWGADCCRPQIKRKATLFLKQNKEQQILWATGERGTVLFWRSDNKPYYTFEEIRQQRKILLQEFLAFATTTKRKQKTTKP